MEVRTVFTAITRGFDLGIERMRRATAGLRAELARAAPAAASGFAGIGRVVGLIPGPLAVARFALAGLGTLAGAVTGSFRFLTGAVEGVVGRVRHLGMIALGTGAAFGWMFERFAQGSIGLAADREAVEQGMVSILGSAKAAAEAMHEIKEVAKEPGVGLSQALQGFNQLTAAEADVRTTIRLIREAGNIVALSGGGPEQLGNFLYGVSQTYGKGKVAAEELQRQILDVAPSLRKALRAAWGTADAEKLTSILEEGKLSVNDFWQRTVGYMEAMPRAANAAKNALANLGIAWQETRIKFGQGLMGEHFTAGITRLSAWLDEMAPSAFRAGVAVRELAEAVVGRLLAAWPKLQRALGDARQWFWDMVGGWDTQALSEQIAGWLEDTWATLYGWGEQLVGWFSTNWGDIKQVVAGAWGAIKQVVSAGASAIWQSLTQFDWTKFATNAVAVMQMLADLAVQLAGWLPQVVAQIKALVEELLRLAGYQLPGAGGAAAGGDQQGPGWWKRNFSPYYVNYDAFGLFGGQPWSAGDWAQAGLAAWGGWQVGTGLGTVTAGLGAAGKWGLGKLAGRRAAAEAAKRIAAGEAADLVEADLAAEAIHQMAQAARAARGAAPGAGDAAGGAGSGFFPGVPAFAAGGIVTRPTLALIGEAGPEAVVPLGRGGVSGAGYTVTVELGPKAQALLSDGQKRAFDRRVAGFFEDVLAGGAGTGGRT